MNPDLPAFADLEARIGRSRAFSAADVESLRRIRDGKEYRELDCSWDEFCTRRLRVPRRTIDRAIGYLEEFGPHYFLLAQMLRIGPKEYRVVAPHVGENGLHVDGKVVNLLPGNTEQITAVVGELLGRARQKRSDRPVWSVDALLKRCSSIADDLEKLGMLDAPQKIDLALAVMRIRTAAASLGVTVI